MASLSTGISSVARMTTKVMQYFKRYMRAVEASERQDVVQHLWEEYVMQVIVEAPPKESDGQKLPPL